MILVKLFLNVITFYKKVCKIFSDKTSHQIEINFEFKHIHTLEQPFSSGSSTFLPLSSSINLIIKMFKNLFYKLIYGEILA